MSAAAATPPARNFVIAVMPLSLIRAAGKRMAARSCSLSLRRWTVAEPAVGQRSFASSLPHQPAKQAVEIGRKLTIARVKEPAQRVAKRHIGFDRRHCPTGRLNVHWCGESLIDCG